MQLSGNTTNQQPQNAQQQKPRGNALVNLFKKNWKTVGLGAALLGNFYQYQENKALRAELPLASSRMNLDNNELLQKGAYAEIIKISKDDPGEVNIFVPNGKDGNAETIIRQIPVRP